MISTIHESTPVARKDYRCNACDAVRDMISGRGNPFTFKEWRAIVKAKQNGWRIKKGEKYLRQFNADGGDTWTYRGIPAISDICTKYKLFEDY
jgi:hypothetical protein